MLFTLLTVLFVGLKLTGYIDWSWWLCFAPVILQLLFAYLAATVVWLWGVKK